MKTSLLDLAAKGEDLPTLDSKIHYPEEGADRLSLIEQDHFWFTERRNIIFYLLKRFLKKTGIGIDVGCGTGYTAVWMTERGFPTVGLDALQGFTHFHDEGKGFGFIQGDLFSIDPSPEFDFVLLMDVIEHIEDHRAFVEQVAKLLKPGGIIIITVPAFSALWSQVDENSGHLRRYRKKDLKYFESVLNTPLKVEFQTYFYFLTLPFYILSRLLSKTDKSLSKEIKESNPPAILNSLIKLILKFEGVLLKRFPLPAGSSLFAVLKKH